MKKRKGCGKNLLKDQRGFALISVYLASLVVLIFSSAAFGSVLVESRLIDREIARTQAYAAAEAGLQTAMVQIGTVPNPVTVPYTGPFTGFVNTARIPTTGEQTFQSVTGTILGSFFVEMDYSNQMDWVTCKATGKIPLTTGTNQILQLEGRVFLQSNLSKYLMYANTPSLALGSNLKMGIDLRDPAESAEERAKHPEGIVANENDRAALYYTNDLDFSGSNIHIFGDTHAENFISGSNSNTIHGDTYVGGFAWDTQGRVTNDGINGTLTVSDGFADDTDRNGDRIINANDYADRHDLLKTTDEMKSYNADARREEVIDTVDLDFYQARNSSVVTQRNYGTTSAERYFVFEPTADATQTNVVVFNAQDKYNAYNPFINTPANTTARTQKTDEFTLPSGLLKPDGTMDEKPILYSKGSIHVKGTIAGRVAVVSSDNILFDGNIKYAGETPSYSSPANSAAFLAKDVVYFRPEQLEASGIIYADNSHSTSRNPLVAIDSNYNEHYSLGDNRGYKPEDKYDGRFRHFGNLIVDGTGNTSNYNNDRAYVYDPNLKYYRPPGLPIRPELRTVRAIQQEEA